MSTNGGDSKRRRQNESEDWYQVIKKPRLHSSPLSTSSQLTANSDGSETKRRRNSEREDEDYGQLEKRQRLESSPLATSSQLSKSLRVEWSSKGSSIRRTSSDSNVKAKMTIDLLSSNPEETTFLMGTIVNELENINQMLSVHEDSNDRSVRRQSPLSTMSNSPASASSPSPQSSPDYYDRLVTSGYEMIERLRQDSDFTKYF